MSEKPEFAMLMSMVRESRAGFVDPKWDELLALIDDQAKTIQGIHQVIANMKSNLGSVATFIEQLEVLVGNGAVMNSEHSQHCHCVCTDLSQFQEAIQRVRAVHVLQKRDGVKFCVACVDHESMGGDWQLWPCETTRALDGEDA